MVGENAIQPGNFCLTEHKDFLLHMQHLFIRLDNINIPRHLRPTRLTAHQLSALEAAIRAESRTGEMATLKEIGAEYGSGAANVRALLKQLVPMGYVGERERGKHSAYVVLKTPTGEPFDRRAAHQAYKRDLASAAPEVGNLKLTAAQAQALEAAQRVYFRAARPVTLAEIAAERKQPSHVVGKHIPALIGRGYLGVAGAAFVVLRDVKWRPVRQPASNIPASGPVRPPLVQVLEHALELASEPDTLQLPILGIVAAGKPIEAIHEGASTFPVPAEWLRGRSGYFLRVVGDSMAPDGIQPGALLLVREEPFDELRPDSIWVCWVEGVGATVKRVRSSIDAAELVASNEAYQPIRATEGTIVQGRVAMAIRVFD